MSRTTAKFLVFDVWSDYAHFKLNYATSSPQTLSFISPSAAMGLLACILGQSWGGFVSKYADGILLAIEIKTGSVQKTRMSMKLLITKDVWLTAPPYLRFPAVSAPVQFELLQNPKFRLYVACPEIEESVETQLKDHKSYYTPYLGLAQFIANFRYVGSGEFVLRNGDVEVSTVLAPGGHASWRPLMSEGFAVERYPRLRIKQGTTDIRDAIGYVDVVIPIGTNIAIHASSYWEGNIDGKITRITPLPV